MKLSGASAALGMCVLLQATPVVEPLTAQAPARWLSQRPSRSRRRSLCQGRSNAWSSLRAARPCLRTDFDIIRIAVTNPAVADAVVVQNREILVDGKSPGTISLIVWSSTDRKHYDLVVEPAITTLQQQLRALFPGEDVTVSATDEAIILSGAVSSNTVALRAAEIAQASSAKVKVINMLQLPSGQESQQVMLQVRFAEVNRRALTELGTSFVVNRADYGGRIATQQFPDPEPRRRGEQRIRIQRFPERVLFQPRRRLGARSSSCCSRRGSFRVLPSRT